MDQGFMVSDKPTLLARLEEQPADALLALIALANADPRPGKIDVGVGVYRDAAGTNGSTAPGPGTEPEDAKASPPPTAATSSTPSSG